MSRVQLALRVSDLEGSIAFYRKLFGVEPAKRRPGYANFAIAEPPLKLVLLEGDGGEPTRLDHLGVEFVGVDVLQSDELREGIKTFSDWPTIPQLYVKGEFIGGSDIVREMFQSGELKTMLSEQGLLQDA